MSKITLEIVDESTALWVVNCFLGAIENSYEVGAPRQIEAKKLYDDLHKQIGQQTTELNFDNILEKLGWTIICQSPLTMAHKDGSNAIGFAAEIVYNQLKENWEDYL